MWWQIIRLNNDLGHRSIYKGVRYHVSPVKRVIVLWSGEGFHYGKCSRTCLVLPQSWECFLKAESPPYLVKGTICVKERAILLLDESMKLRSLLVWFVEPTNVISIGYGPKRMIGVGNTCKNPTDCLVVKCTWLKENHVDEFTTMMEIQRWKCMWFIVHSLTELSLMWRWRSLWSWCFQPVRSSAGGCGFVNIERAMKARWL